MLIEANPVVGHCQMNNILTFDLRKTGIFEYFSHFFLFPFLISVGQGLLTR